MRKLIGLLWVGLIWASVSTAQPWGIINKGAKIVYTPGAKVYCNAGFWNTKSNDGTSTGVIIMQNNSYLRVQGDWRNEGTFQAHYNSEVEFHRYACDYQQISALEGRFGKITVNNPEIILDPALPNNHLRVKPGGQLKFADHLPLAQEKVIVTNDHRVILETKSDSLTQITGYKTTPDGVRQDHSFVSGTIQWYTLHGTKNTFEFPVGVRRSSTAPEPLYHGLQYLQLNIDKPVQTAASIQSLVATVFGAPEIESFSNECDIEDIESYTGTWEWYAHSDIAITPANRVPSCSDYALILHPRDYKILSKAELSLETLHTGATSYQIADVCYRGTDEKNQIVPGQTKFTKGIGVKGNPKPMNFSPISLEATPINNRWIRLQWQNISTEGLKYFIVEKSTDGKNFATFQNPIELKKSNKKEYYVLDDYAVQFNTRYYYRLLLKFENGAERRSHIVEAHLINNLNAAESEIKLYPNPTTGILKLNIYAADEQSIKIKIFNALGQLMLEAQNDLSTGFQELELSNFAQSVPAGTYSLQIEGKNFRTHQHWVKL